MILEMILERDTFVSISTFTPSIRVIIDTIVKSQMDSEPIEL